MSGQRFSHGFNTEELCVGGVIIGRFRDCGGGLIDDRDAV